MREIAKRIKRKQKAFDGITEDQVGEKPFSHA